MKNIILTLILGISNLDYDPNEFDYDEDPKIKKKKAEQEALDAVDEEIETDSDGNDIDYD